MGTSISLKKKVYVCYYYSNNMNIELLRKKINKEGYRFDVICKIKDDVTRCFLEIS